MRQYSELLSYERAHELLLYDAEQGTITRKNPTKLQAAVKVAGAYRRKRDDLYKVIMVDRRCYLVHRLAWMMTHGKWPELIDHVNGDSTDNRLLNLREATHADNMRNSKKPKNNTSGYKGVSWIKKHRRWQATIQVNRRSYNLGRFDDPQTAHAAYTQAAKRLHGQFARVE